MSSLTLGTPATYRITVQGYLDSSWSDDLGGLAVSKQVAADGSTQTLLTGWLVDQAALFGVLDRLYGLGFPLVSVECVEINHGEQAMKMPMSD
jgi:hypothetical protein